MSKNTKNFSGGATNLKLKKGSEALQQKQNKHYENRGIPGQTRVPVGKVPMDFAKLFKGFKEVA
jgi:hypothetical protein